MKNGTIYPDKLNELYNLISENFAVVSLKLHLSQITLYKEVPQFTMASFIGSLGVILNLYSGVSFVIVVELVDFLMHLFDRCFSSRNGWQLCLFRGVCSIVLLVFCAEICVCKKMLSLCVHMRPLSCVLRPKILWPSYFRSSHQTREEWFLLLAETGHFHFAHHSRALQQPRIICILVVFRAVSLLFSKNNLYFWSAFWPTSGVQYDGCKMQCCLWRNWTPAGMRWNSNLWIFGTDRFDFWGTFFGEMIMHREMIVHRSEFESSIHIKL